MPNDEKMIYFAHRGARGLEPENTLLAFGRALELGSKWIELDVYPVENELVVFHDLRLERTTNGRGFVWKQPLAALRALDARARKFRCWPRSSIWSVRISASTSN